MTRRSHQLEKAVGRARLRKNKSGRYAVERSPLWKLQSLHKLAELLNVPQERLESTLLSPTYNRFEDDPKPGKEARQIQEPTGETLRIHYRLTKLLDSIARPDFLHSATKKRSHITNASAHTTTTGPVVATDIRKFFESTTYHHVKDFFYRDLGCAYDVAKFLATVCTADAHLPTGSCISPLLSYFCHRHTFAEIELLCKSSDLVMTLYVDDLTISGGAATKTLLHKIKKIIRKQGLKTHPKKDAIIRPGKPTIITGVIRKPGESRLRNRHHSAIIELQDQLAEGLKISEHGLRGRMAAAKAVEPVAGARLEARFAKILREKAKSDSAGHDATCHGSE